RDSYWLGSARLAQMQKGTAEGGIKPSLGF
ncbi:unnamed protein product, partial [marine sediment metagenome]